MSLNRVIKITSNEGGQITANNNLLSFSIGQNTGVFDLSKSFINLRCNVTGDDPSCVAMPHIQFNDDQNVLNNARVSNAGMVRNVNMNCAKGSIANIRRVDLLKNTLQYYQKTTDELQSTSYKSFMSSFDKYQQMSSIFRDIKRIGDIPSRNISGDIQIMLKDLVNFGNVTAYDTSKFGTTNINLELNMDKIVTTQYLGATPAINGTLWAQNGRNACQNLSLTVGADLSTLYTKRQFTDLQGSPYWVNQKITIGYTDRAGAVQSVVRTILSINYGTDYLELLLDSAIEATPLTTTETFTLITAVGVDQVLTFNCDYGELVLEQLTDMTSDMTPSEISYTEFSSEEYTGGAVSNFQRQFNVEPECMNLLIMRSGGLVSDKKNIENWRLRLDNKDLTNRNINYHSPLSLDRVAMTLGNGNMLFKNTNELFQKINLEMGQESEVWKTYEDNKLVLISNPLPLTQSNKMVQVNIKSSTADIVGLVLYKELLISI
tara:strand:- start:1352 stop:2821 length:1470 start_codon:yes stop_codon:yes gene_type:complete